jgi:hypothetical protein
MAAGAEASTIPPKKMLHEMIQKITTDAFACEVDDK